MLFGTVFLPRGRQPARYGIDDAIPPGWIERLMFPFRRRATDRLREMGPVQAGGELSGRLGRVHSEDRVDTGEHQDAHHPDQAPDDHVSAFSTHNVPYRLEPAKL